jgi:hypothetical protein
MDKVLVRAIKKPQHNSYRSATGTTPIPHTKERATDCERNPRISYKYGHGERSAA